MDNPNPKFKLIIFGSLSIFSFLIFLIVWYINRAKPFLNTILWFIIVLTIFGIFAGIVYLIIWLFKKQKIDLLFVMKNQVVESCKINKPEEKTAIVLYDNKSTKMIGSFEGFTMIKTAEWMQYIDEKNKDEKDFYSNLLKIDKKIPEEFIYLISCKTTSGKDELLLCVENDFNDINSSPIVLYGRGFAPKMYEFMFLAKHYDMAEKIELPVKSLAYKYALEHNLRDMVNVIDNAIDIDANHRKDQEKSNIDDFTPSKNN